MIRILMQVFWELILIMTNDIIVKFKLNLVDRDNA